LLHIDTGLVAEGVRSGAWQSFLQLGPIHLGSCPADSIAWTVGALAVNQDVHLVRFRWVLGGLGAGWEGDQSRQRARSAEQGKKTCGA
jgi:hypothetical protein